MVGFPSYSLDIKQTQAQIGVRSKNAELQIEMTPSAWERQQPLEWRALPRRAEIEINNDAWRAEFDIETPVAWTTKIAGEAAAYLEQETRWRAQNGDLCYRATPGDLRPLLDYAMHYFNLQDAVDYNVDLSPHSPPQITAHVDPAQEFEVEPLSASTFSYRISATRPDIEIYMAVQPEVQIKAVPMFDHKV